ncbi:MAG: response regulator transcription factor [Rubrobacteraceae bacterium]
MGPNGAATILVADDDRIIRRIITVKLSGLGYEVLEAMDGLEVLDQLEGGNLPDLLITDSLMPRLGGIQLIREIRNSADADRAALPVIMLTSRNGERDVIEGLEAGLDDYMIKPFSPDELAARVHTVLWRTRRI